MPIKVFIGSSLESLFIAKAIRDRLDDDLVVKVWDTAFSHGDFFLETLYKELFLTDFGLFIIAPDDRIFRRRKKEYTTRDNVVFELGLFIGALGLKKAYFVLVDIKKNGKEMKIALPSDLGGINRISMKLELAADHTLLDTEQNKLALAMTAERIKKDLLYINGHISLNLLPSTSLAIGYFENFILKACKELSTEKNFEFDGSTYDLTKDIFDFNVVIPDNGSDMGHSAYRRFVNRCALKQIDVRSKDSARTFPFFINIDMNNGRVQLFDLPTTLRASWDTIRMIMPKNTTENELKELEIKEIANFTRTLRHLLSHPDHAEFRDNVKLITVSELIDTKM
ncbi:hypothetical protein GCM10023093_30580 [Nemorincola caseinilytica]|uniref:CD-NTase-associated protein 12 n=1 Tax=Nemorincola caseinilytica TaxID=2054315 RepID=A0ABP8NRC0_9BACT